MELKSKINSNMDYPIYSGKLWTKDEEMQLLRELSNNIDKEIIARNHGRTIGGINSRIRFIAVRMYMSNDDITNIIEKTKLDRCQVIELIEKHNREKRKKKSLKSKINIESEILEIKRELIYMNKSMEKSNIENEILELKYKVDIMNKNMEKIFKLLENLELAE